MTSFCWEAYVAQPDHQLIAGVLLLQVCLAVVADEVAVVGSLEDMCAIVDHAFARLLDHHPKVLTRCRTLLCRGQ